MRAECPLLALSRHHFFRDVLRVARFVLRIGFFTAVFRPRAVLSRGLSDLMTASTAAWAAAVPAAVAALRLYLNQGLEAAMRESGAFSAVVAPEEEG